MVFCTVVLITGPLWGRRAWGIWWTWDARLTTTLVLWLIYVSYLLLRRFAAGPQMQTLAAVLGIFGALDVPIVYMSNRWWRTQHPAPVFGGGPDSGIKDPAMLDAFGWNVLAWFCWGILVLVPSLLRERRHQQYAAHEAQEALKPTSNRVQNEENNGPTHYSRSPIRSCCLHHHLGHSARLSGWLGLKWRSEKRNAERRSRQAR